MSAIQPLTSVSLQHAQANLPGLVASLSAQGEITITDNDRPVARLVAPASTGERKLGSMAGSVLYMSPDFDAPIEDFREYQ